MTLPSSATAGAGSCPGLPFARVKSKFTEKSNHRISKLALACSRSGSGPSSVPSTVTLKRLVEPCFSCTEAWKSMRKCGGSRVTRASKPRSPVMLKLNASA